MLVKVGPYDKYLIALLSLFYICQRSFTHIRFDYVIDAELMERLSQRLRNNPEQYGWIDYTDSLFTWYNHNNRKHCETVGLVCEIYVHLA